MADMRAALLEQIETERESYYKAARWEEIAHWTGSSIAAVSSALAAVGAAAGSNIMGPEVGKYAIAILAVVPAVWAAIDRSLSLRSLSLFSYGVSAEFEALAVDVRYKDTLDLNAAATRFSEIIRREHDAFAKVLTGEQRTALAKPAEGKP